MPAVRLTSLRARLVTGLLAIAAVGLILLAGITYASQRSFLLNRVDDQARDGLPAIGRELDEQLGLDRGPLGLRRPRPGGGPPTNLPPGTYGERIGADGEVLAAVGVAFGEASPAAPDLPDDVQPGELRTVEAGGERYRVAAEPARRSEGTTVIAVPLGDVDQTLDRLLLVEALVIVAVLAALGAAATVVVRVGLRPLDHMAETAGAIAAGDLSRRVDHATPDSEAGRLGIALNAMLGRLEQAFAERQASEDRLRRFVADASHELRTPLASIRGYAELFRMGAAQDAADTSTAMRRIEEEARRMGVLVEDLLALARLDETREVVRTPVDAGDLVADAVEDARVTAPDREITSHVAPGEDPVVLADPDQLRQVLANLVRNALVHTPPGTPVEVRAAATGDRIRLEVRDHGPGLPDGDPAALFERFWRGGGAGRKQGPAGAGLGLAIVAAIVDAHGGTVRAENAAGGGARFVVELPAFAVPGATPVRA